MENKQTFGAFICQRRKEMGMTQKEFAQKLYVTDSAVSKWERGLAYPDITLLQDICAALQISEKELLSASEDTEGRRVELLAKKYLRLARSYRLIQYILYGLTALTCLICNLAVQHTLSWFWIVLSAELVAASLTLLPALAPEGRRSLWTLGGFTGALLLLLGVCCLYTGGTWFLSAALWTLFGLCCTFLPLVLRQLPLGPFSRHKAFLWLYAATVLLLLGLAWEGWNSWFLPQGLLIALTCLTLPWGLLGCIRYLPVNRWFRTSASCFWTGLWYWLFPWCLDRAMILGGWQISEPYDLRLPVNFLDWSHWQVTNANITLLILLALSLAGTACCAAGFLRRRR